MIRGKEEQISPVRIVCCVFLMILWVWLDISNQYILEADLSLPEQSKLIQQATQQNMWVRSDIQGTRTDYFFWYDATDEYIYFSYTDDNCIDVYDLKGTFQYTLYLPDSPNGAPTVYCQDGITYIDCKGSTAFIFEGNEFIQRLDGSEEMEQYGYYEITEFIDPSLTGIEITKEYVRRYASDGTLMFEFPTPDMVKATLNTSIWTKVPPIWFLFIFMLLFSMVIICVVYTIRSNDRNRSRKCGTRLQNPELYGAGDELG